jgi:hypothetical protein
MGAYRSYNRANAAWSPPRIPLTTRRCHLIV